MRYVKDLKHFWCFICHSKEHPSYFLFLWKIKLVVPDLCWMDPILFPIGRELQNGTKKESHQQSEYMHRLKYWKLDFSISLNMTPQPFPQNTPGFNSISIFGFCRRFNMRRDSFFKYNMCTNISSMYSNILVTFVHTVDNIKS